MDNTQSDTIWVIVGDSHQWLDRNDVNRSPVDIHVLSKSVKNFLQQVENILKETQEYVGQFHFEEFELSAEVSADGSLAILGTGVHAGTKGGLKFVFRRPPSSESSAT